VDWYADQVPCALQLKNIAQSDDFTQYDHGVSTDERIRAISPLLIESKSYSNGRKTCRLAKRCATA
jgi:hypothetical protein